MPDATATAASWASSTARSPTMWQRRMVGASRSATSLQNPVGRPSMIGPGSEPKRSVPTTTSWVSRAAASLRPRRDLLVLAHEDAGGGLEQDDARPERVEDRGHLDPGRTGADHQQRAGHRLEAPRVAVGAGQLEPRDREPTRDAAGAHDPRPGAQPRSVVALDHVRLEETSGSRVLVDPDPGLPPLVAQGRVRAHVAGHLAHAREQTPIVKRRLPGVDPVTRELPRLPDESRGV